LYFILILVRKCRNILASLEQWRKDKRTSAWLWIPIEKAHVIPVAAELGKEFILYNDEI
jgi:hypothetical protein